MNRPATCLRAAFLCAAILLSPTARARQSDEVRSTEAQLDALKAQIAADEARLQRTRSEERASRQKLDQATRDIRLREQLVSTYEQRISEFEEEIDVVWSTIRLLDARVADLTAEYGERVRSAYRRGRMNDVALILAANSVNQMLVRVSYLRRFQDDRIRRRGDLREAAETLEQRRTQLQETIRQTEEMRRETIVEKERLADLRAEREDVVSQLRSRADAIELALRDKRNAELAMRTRLRQLLAAASARRDAAGSAAADEAFRALTGSFEENRGRLPWPSAGTVIEAYGWTVDPVSRTRTQNPGLFVAAPGGADIRAVFEGLVEDVGIIAEYGRYVMISHGGYVTVYGNLSSAGVSPGDRVTAGAVIGRAGTTAETRGSGYFFGLFKGDDFIDPTPWLRRN